MSERPFMQLYVSDFLGDTLDLSTEGIGAYMLLLMAMWNAGGTLPDDEAKLARITRMSVKKWRAVAADLLIFFVRDQGRITHRRLSKELQKSETKSELRASAGKRGGEAKALKDKSAALANAIPLPQHLPDTRSQTVIEPIAQQPIAEPRKEPMLLDRLFEAAGIAGFREERHPGLLRLGPALSWLDRGYDLERDILPVIRDRARNKTFRSWDYFTDAIVDAATAKIAIPQRPAEAVVDWNSRLNAWREDGTWGAWGPKPGDPGCRVPPELLRGIAA